MHTARAALNAPRNLNNMQIRRKGCIRNRRRTVHMFIYYEYLTKNCSVVTSYSIHARIYHICTYTQIKDAGNTVSCTERRSYSPYLKRFVENCKRSSVTRRGMRSSSAITPTVGQRTKAYTEIRSERGRIGLRDRTLGTRQSDCRTLCRRMRNE